MKKILTFIMMLIIALSVFSCSRGGKTEQTTHGTQNSAASSTAATTAPTVSARPSLYPDKPEGLEERIQYEYTDEGLYIVKAYFDGKGNPVEEHYYTIDSELGVLCCEIISYNSFDERGDLVFSEGHYVKNPYHSVKESVLTVKELDGIEYSYSVTDEYGNILMYIKVTEDSYGRSVKEEYYGMSGRLIRTEETEYHANGNVSLHKSVSASGKTLFICEYDEKGNFTKCVSYRNNGNVKAETSAEYHENGALSKYKVVSYSESGGVSGVSTTEFFDDGRISSAPGRGYAYRQDGTLAMVTKNLTDRYSYDIKGYLVKYDGRINGQVGTSLNISYTYNESGALTSVVSRSHQSEYNYSVKYTYRKDGSLKIARTNQYGIENHVVYTDERCRTILEETHNNERRTKYYVYEYDSYNNIKRIRFYEDDVIAFETEYGYNKHGDLIREHTVDYYMLSVASTETVNHEYYSDGELRLTVKYNDEGYKTYEREYFKDGGYMYSEYDFHGNVSRAETFDKNGNNTRSVAEENGATVTINRKFYENGRKKSEFAYRDGVLESGYEYSENGGTVREYRTDENGDVIAIQTIREGGLVVKINKWKNGEFAGYTDYTYFEKYPGYPVPVQYEKGYDADGVMTYYLERAVFAYPAGDTFYHDALVIKEEWYEDGKTVGYRYADYIIYMERNSIAYEEILDGGVLCKKTYTYESRPVENADDDRVTVCREEKYRDGELISLVIIESFDSGRIVEFIYGTDGKLYEKRYYYGEGMLSDYVLYEYHENGALRAEKGYRSNGLPTYEAAYSERGIITLKNTFFYSSVLEVCREKTEYYDEEGRIIRELDRDGSSSIADTLYSYDDRGNLVKSEKTADGVLKERITYEYDGMNNMTRNYKEIYGSSGSAPLTEEYTYEYNGKGQLVRETHAQSGLNYVTSEYYEYHENGKMSLHYHFFDDVIAWYEFFDEDGNRIYL